MVTQHYLQNIIGCIKSHANRIRPFRRWEPKRLMDGSENSTREDTYSRVSLTWLIASLMTRMEALFNPIEGMLGFGNQTRVDNIQ